MPATMTGDFSNYPEELLDVMPYLLGEVCYLRHCWQVYHHLFISNEKRTLEYANRLGGLLGMLQRYLSNEIMIGTARLLDLDGKQKNLTFWALHERCKTWNPCFANELKPFLDSLALHCTDIRTHRNKRIAHFDLSVSLGQTVLPSVILSQLREAIEKMEAALNLVSRKAINTTTYFQALDHRDSTTQAEITVFKAMAYDEAVQAGKIDSLQWRKHIHREKNQ